MKWNLASKNKPVLYLECSFQLTDSGPQQLSNLVSFNAGTKNVLLFF